MPSPITESENPAVQTSPCESCESGNFTFVCGRKDGTRIARCTRCGLEAVNPLPDSDSLDSTYNLDMRRARPRALDNSPLFKTYITQHIERKKSFNKTYRKQLNLIERFSKKKGSLLDVGCGAGFFLHYAKSKSWNVSGLDLLEEYVQFAKEELKIESVQRLPLAEAEFPEQSFDVVTLMDIIEHFPHPLHELKRIHQLLKPGGHLTIWTPNVKNAIFMKENWTGYITFQHLYFFSLETLGQLLKQTGFSIVFSKTSKAKKGLLIPKDSLTFKEIEKPKSAAGRLLFSVKRDFKNALNPMTYLNPLFNMGGYGFNLLVIAEKKSTDN